jgi:hypothetical protein
VRFSFDAGLGRAVRDTGGRLSLRQRTAAGGALRTTAHGGGLAVRFPQPCAHYGAESCRRAILESGPAGFLNPGRAPFRYGATVQLSPGETSKGANVLQKGYSAGGSQFKLQVDGAAGQPSCVLVGGGPTQIYLALASRTVADGRWHSVECMRRDAVLEIRVDGMTAGRTAVPSALSIVNSEPLCVGGKGTSPNNDQFTGVIDDIFVSLDG